MKARFTDEQIIGMIKEQESVEKTADVCRRHGISSATFYKYKSKYGGMEPSDAKRLRALEDENGKLKKLLAEHWGGPHRRSTPMAGKPQGVLMHAQGCQSA